MSPMDDEQVLQLRTWAGRLAIDDRAEVRAAGKAIVMLADELSSLRAQRRLESEARFAESDSATPVPVSDPSDADVASSLRTRLRSLVGVRDAEPASRTAEEKPDTGHMDG